MTFDVDDRHPIPPHVRQSVYQRAAGACELCHVDRPLELHHLTYHLADVTGYSGHQGMLVFGYETPDVLVALCRDCHEVQHRDPNGDFWTDPIEMATYWAKV